MLAVITGASGLLGGNLAVELLQEGHRVRAIRRSSSRVDHLTDFDIEWLNGDLNDGPALTAAFLGADVVFHCAAAISIRRTATPELVATNVDGTGRVLAAVRSARVPRLVHCSTVGAIGLSENGRPCTESARWNFREHRLANGYVTTKREAETLVVKEVEGGLDAVIVNPTYMLGPYDARPSSGRLILDVVRGRILGYPSGLNNFVDARDVARGMIRVWKRGKPGERYILGGDNLSYRDIVHRIAREAGVMPPRWPIPRPIARLIGWGGDLLERVGQEPLLNSTTVRYAFTGRFQFCSDKARTELGYQNGSLDAAIADAIAWFRKERVL